VGFPSRAGGWFRKLRPKLEYCVQRWEGAGESNLEGSGVLQKNELAFVALGVPMAWVGAKHGPSSTRRAFPP
jgi:hypothetical protein